MKILICPLDWGLGHATRCIPIIRQAIKDGHEVHIACEDNPSKLLTREFSQIKRHKLNGIQVRYSSKVPMSLSMLLQLPELIYAIYSEYSQIQMLQSKENFDCIISDNRFGVWSKSCHNIYMTHQITIATPHPFKFLEVLTRLGHRLLYRKFQELWIPDSPSNHPNHLAGYLSQSNASNSKYLGNLSRFSPPETQVIKNYDLMLSLSGPEPLRTEFENVLKLLLTGKNLKICVLRGLPQNEGQAQTFSIEGNEVHVFYHLNSNEFKDMLLSSTLIISRSGYSSLMDYQALGITALIVPTPGQTEQEYLSDELGSQGRFYTCRQDHLTWNKIKASLHAAQKEFRQPINNQLDETLWQDIKCS